MVDLSSNDVNEIILVDEYVEQDSFTLDTEGCADETKNRAYVESETSSQNQSVHGELSPPKELSSRRSNVTCFNCLGDHTVSRCPEPIDRGKIALNREGILSGKRRECFNGPRFHEEPHKKSQPGIIGEELRNALGIGQYGIPPWIYRMRQKGFVAGYPPGYKAKAIEKSTLKFIVSDENTASKHTEDDDDHEYTFDPSKIISYPGFNSADDRLNDKEKGKWVTPPWKNFLSAFKKEVNDRNEGVRRAKQYRIVRDTRYEQHIIQQFDPLKPPPPLFNDNGARKRTHLSSETTPPSSIKTKTRRIEQQTTYGYLMEEGEILDEDSPVSANNARINENGSEDKATLATAAPDKATLATAAPERNNDIEHTLLLGTPIPLQRHISTEKFNHEFEKPPLEKWAAGIQPFQYSEEPKREQVGFFKRMHTLIKSLGSKKEKTVSHVSKINT